MTTEAELPIPAWFKYRQGKAEPAGEYCFKLTAPVKEDAFIKVRPLDGRWEAVLLAGAEGPERLTSGPRFASEHDAWCAAFEMYRAAMIY
jgi:hypothetical protein